MRLQNAHGIVNGEIYEFFDVDKSGMNRHNKDSRKISALEARSMPVVRVDAKVNQELYSLLAIEADRENVSLGELLVRFAAAQLGRPELGFVPKSKPGPKPGFKRKDLAITA